MMISHRSIQNFVLVNGSVLLIGSAFYFIEQLNPFLILFLMIIKNYITLEGINPKNNSKLVLPAREFFKSTCIDTLSYCIIRSNFTYPTTSISYDILYFIPVSFAYELIFDFFYYWAHRKLHMNLYLYKTIHATHHHHAITSVYTTFHHSLLDLMITNTIPLILASSFIHVSSYTFVLLFCYKNIAEIAGHSGVDKKTPSFVQCIWLPKILGIELYTKNHCLHHEMPTVNFSKRFSIWDKVFGTFNPRMPNQMSNKNGKTPEITYDDTSVSRI